MLKPIRSLTDLQSVVNNKSDLKQKILITETISKYNDISHTKFMFWNLFEVLKQIHLGNLFYEIKIRKQ